MKSLKSQELRCIVLISKCMHSFCVIVAWHSYTLYATALLDTFSNKSELNFSIHHDYNMPSFYFITCVHIEVMVQALSGLVIMKTVHQEIDGKEGKQQ